MEELPDGSRVKVSRVKIIVEGTDECRKNIQEIKEEIQSLNECIQVANNGIEQLAKNIKYLASCLEKQKIILM